MPAKRTLLGGFAGADCPMSCAALPPIPSAAYQTPPVPPLPVPEIQNAVPSTVVAPRALLPLKAASRSVLASIAPEASTRATARLVDDEVLVATDAVPAAAA